MLQIIHTYFVIGVASIARIERSILTQIRSFEPFLQKLLAAEDNVRRNSCTVAAYGLDTSKRFAIVRISDCKLSMRLSCDDVLIFFNAYSEAGFVYIEYVLVQYIILYPSVFVEAENLGYSLDVMSILSIDDQRFLLSN